MARAARAAWSRFDEDVVLAALIENERAWLIDAEGRERKIHYAKALGLQVG